MQDIPEKTHHAVQMAVVARLLASAAPDPHRKRVIARYVFVYLDDVVRFAPAWRNQLLGAASTKAAGESALPALTRLRNDWEHYEDVRNFIAAKRQPRDPRDPVTNEIDGFKLWADIGSLAVDALVDDAIEIYAQLASVTSAPHLDLDPTIPEAVVEALNDLDPVGEDAALEIVATSFGADRAGAITLRMGGDVGRLVPMINDVAENINTLMRILEAVGTSPLLMRLLQCQLPSEVFELLRLALGAEPGAAASAQDSLVDLYSRPGSPPRPKTQLEAMRDYADACFSRAELRNYRNQLGAHIDDNAPWADLQAGMAGMDLAAIARVTTYLLEYLECCAVEPGGPFPLLFPSRKLTSLVATSPTSPVAYDDPDAEGIMAGIPFSGPPAGFDSGYAVWVRGAGPYGSAAVAGMHSARVAEIQERIARRQASGSG